MSMTKSEPAFLTTFASLRFKGDLLDPDRVTAILGSAPTTAYRRGEVFKRSGGHAVQGRTGLWLVSSEGRVSSPELERHLRYLLAIVFPEGSNGRLQDLRDLMRDERLKADVSCFWYGESGARPPAIPEDVRAAFARLPAEIETDFTSSRPGQKQHRQSERGRDDEEGVVAALRPFVVAAG